MKKQSFKRILITGATGDIAQALIKKLSQFEVHLLARDKAKLEAIYGLQDRFYFYDYDEIDQIPEIDILINNAGFAVFERFFEQKISEIEEQFEVNSLLPIRLVHQIKPKVQVINIASIAGKLPTSKSSIYAASKAALIVFSDVIRLESPDLIITTVNTGPVTTKFHINNQDYLKKVGKNAVSADFVAEKIVKNLGKKKKELNLPIQMAILARLRAIFPNLVDFIGNKFFNLK